MPTALFPLALALGLIRIPHACALGLRSASAYLGIGLAITGLCFLALWSLDLVRPPPRHGALLLIVSLLGAASVAVGLGPRHLAVWEVPLAIVTICVLVVVVPLMLLATRRE